jgi:5-methylcytosine-specific restriction protein B
VSFGPKHDDIVRAFIAALATKRLVILTGLSGSGKTQIALRFGDWLGAGRSLVVPVRPDWTGAEALFGYEDALQQPSDDGRRVWHVPDALAFMLEAAAHRDDPYLLVLDEMNLAHVERYFADVLSGMESDRECLPNLRREKDGRWRLATDGPARVLVPQNLFVVGTVNVDETTYLFSPKVLDRANTFEFRVETGDLSANARKPVACKPAGPELTRGLLAIATDDQWHLDQPAGGADTFVAQLKTLHSLVAEGGFEFGHRVFYEAVRFSAMFEAVGDADPVHALDRQIMQKVLPRLHGSRRRLEPTLCALGRFCFDLSFETGSIANDSGKRFDPLAPPSDSRRLPISFDKVQRMTRGLRAHGFTSFTEQ